MNYKFLTNLIHYNLITLKLIYFANINAGILIVSKGYYFDEQITKTSFELGRLEGKFQNQSKLAVRISPLFQKKGIHIGNYM